MFPNDPTFSGVVVKYRPVDLTVLPLVTAPGKMMTQPLFAFWTAVNCGQLLLTAALKIAPLSVPQVATPVGPDPLFRMGSRKVAALPLPMLVRTVWNVVNCWIGVGPELVSE
jgi:hypothetical protein